MKAQHKLHQLLQSFVVSYISYNFFSLFFWSTVDFISLPSYIILPFVQIAMTSITEKIQRILRSTLSSNVVDDDNKIQDKTTILSSETQNRLKLREVLEDQHRMMYYTVTVSTVTSIPLEQVSRRKTSMLKWQYASTLSKTQATMRKSTVMCPTYYNITYLGELLETDEDDDSSDYLDDKFDIEIDDNCTAADVGAKP